ncbi:MAG: LysM peptidoglycan-binding domain-containing protein [Phycisphaerales bacterium JB038]
MRDDPLAVEPEAPAFDPEEHQPVVIGGTHEDIGQQIRDFLGQETIPTAPVQTTRNEGGLVHTVRPRESLAALARRYYHDTQRWPEIFNANRHLLDSPDLVREGMQLRIPGVSSSRQTPPASERSGMPRVDRPQVRTYTIKSGDVLSVVSQRLTGTSRNWRRIYEANRDVIDDPDRLIPGRTIRIPADLAFPS